MLLCQNHGISSAPHRNELPVMNQCAIMARERSINQCNSGYCRSKSGRYFIMCRLGLFAPPAKDHQAPQKQRKATGSGGGIDFGGCPHLTVSNGTGTQGCVDDDSCKLLQPAGGPCSSRERKLAPGTFGPESNSIPTQAMTQKAGAAEGAKLYVVSS